MISDPGVWKPALIDIADTCEDDKEFELLFNACPADATLKFFFEDDLKVFCLIFVYTVGFAETSCCIPIVASQ